MRTVLAGLLLLLLLAGQAAAAPPAPSPAPEEPWTACRRAILAEEGRAGLPPGLLLSIALVETGRSDARSGRFEPWPWSLNVEGEGRILPSHAAAVAEVAALQAAGRRSIDIGCMQVNLLHHPDAFPDLATGFRPEANIRYAAGFLRTLHARLGSWPAAIANYHSGDPDRGASYHRRVVMARLGRAWGAGGGAVPIAAAAARGLCAPGLRPVLLIKGKAPRPHIGCRKPGQAEPREAAWPAVAPRGKARAEAEIVEGR
ncbi:transglycosylase SLT domain-containing protein [Roseicella aquatilis]|uniref:Lytic transglycosylase domain-containing protein n=1 Tax=Roseicella aquatilis TaxID=2527868 RepID=A0A4V2WM38_9PROT|nr:transglycosylase SLT domain-containing protein [Roseicella aquatilis]TCZ66182.1 lytic transglycosylase domain-containing protein [Roseicella aquatilis]